MAMNMNNDSRGYQQGGCGMQRMMQKPYPSQLQPKAQYVPQPASGNMGNSRSCYDNCDKNTIIKNVYEIGFVLTEVMMYLDTHPTDSEALAYYAEMKEQYKMCTRRYNELCGPLTMLDVKDDNYWTWIAKPMPWEMEG